MYPVHNSLSQTAALSIKSASTLSSNGTTTPSDLYLQEVRARGYWLSMNVMAASQSVHTKAHELGMEKVD